MSRYIEREAVMKTARDGYHSDFGKSMADLTSLREVLEDTPTADVVEVVRCKDCRWRGTEECSMYYRCNCGEQHTWENNNDFCSYGVKKE